MIKKITKKTEVKTKPKATKKVAKVSVAEKKVKEEIKKIEEISKPAAPLGEKPPALEKKKIYLYAVGKRKSGIAKVKIYKNGSGLITINGKDYRQYFPSLEFQEIVTSPLKSVGQSDKLDIEVKVNGGGKRGQAEAIRLGISRALINLNPNFKKNLRRAGFLTRDARVKERKKYGLKRARRAPQWQKR